MNPAPPPFATCSKCQTVLDPQGTCPRCRASEDWADQIEAVDFVVRRLIDWHKSSQLTDRQVQVLSDQYAKRREAMAAAVTMAQPFERDNSNPSRHDCWSCREYLAPGVPYCHACGAPIDDPGVRSLRYWRFLYNELQKHEESGSINLRQTHDLLGEVQERVYALQQKLERERAPFVLPVDEEPAAQPRPRRYDEDDPVYDAGPRRTLIEFLVDPQSIQWLLAAGGALIVLGLVIWLASLGLFENAGFVALALGLGNVALLGGGWALILRTGHQHAGRALTLLACLVMPLNLWFYHSHGIMRLEDNLWIAALICCVIYTASAFILKDSLFVYVLVGGITLTGMLILGQMHRFGEIIAPTTFLIVLGLICLHMERAFPPLDSPFSRQRFGMAFYWCSVALVASGLLLLLGAQLIGWSHLQIFPNGEHFDVVKRDYLPWTLALVLAGTYGYIYSDLVVRKIGVYIYFAAITVLWAEIHVLVLFNLADVPEIIIIALALTALVANALQVSLREKHDFLRVVPPLGVLLSLLPVMLGTLLYLRAGTVLRELAPFHIDWLYVGAMANAAICSRAGAHLYRHTLREVSVFYFFATAAATLLFAAGLTSMMGLQAFEAEAPLVTIVPILYLAASYLYRGHSPEKPLLWVGHAAIGILVFFSALVTLGRITVEGFDPIQGNNRNLLLSLFCLEVTIFYALATYLQRTNWTMYLAAVMFSGAVWQLLKYFHTPDEFYVVAFALAGFGLLVLYRFGVFENLQLAGLDRGIFQSANALATLGFASGALLSISRFMRPEVGDWKDTILIMVVILIALTAISLISVWLVQHQAWRRVHIVFSIINGLLIVLMLNKLNALSPWQKLEIVSILFGLVMLGIGYVGWYRETERSSDLISMAFVFGSLGLAGPLFLASAIWRFGFSVSGWDELGLVAACLALFASGVVCRIKATTIVGAFTMILYIFMVLIYMHRFLKETVIIGIYLTLGGVLLFGTGLFLSVYRDRLLALPGRIRRREGIFRIFDWR